MVEAIAGVLTCVLATIALTLIELSAAVPADETGGRVTLTHGAAWRGLAGLVIVIFSVFFVLLVVEAMSSGLELAHLVAVPVVLSFLAAGVWMSREGRRRFVLDAIGIHFGGADCSVHTMEWQDVRSVEHSPMRERIAVQDVSGRIASISTRMRGLDRLWSLLEQHVAPEIWSAASVKCRGRRGRGRR